MTDKTNRVTQTSKIIRVAIILVLLVGVMAGLGILIVGNQKSLLGTPFSSNSSSSIEETHTKSVSSIPSLFEPDEKTEASIIESYGKLPMRFEVNQGQTDSQVQFLSRGKGYNLFLTRTEAVLSLSHSDLTAAGEGKLINRARRSKDHRANTESTSLKTKLKQTVLRMKLLGANPNPQVDGLEELPGKSNYFVGKDPNNYHTNIPNFAKVQYKDIYAGIDLVYYGNQDQLEYDFVIAPGSDPKVITLAFEGAQKIHIDKNGELVISTASGEVRHHKLLCYQDVDGVRHEISGSYIQKNNFQIGYQLNTYDSSKSLVIDPVLEYSTFLGGSNQDSGNSVAIDPSGNAYVTGSTGSPNFPTTTGVFDTTYNGGGDVFVAKLNATGSGLVYSTYLGGSESQDFGFGRDRVKCCGNKFRASLTPSVSRLHRQLRRQLHRA